MIMGKRRRKGQETSGKNAYREEASLPGGETRAGTMEEPEDVCEARWGGGGELCWRRIRIQTTDREAGGGGGGEQQHGEAAGVLYAQQVLR